MMQHGNYDAFWKARNVRQHLKNVKPAVLTVGGWFDAENLFGALECYQAIEASTPGANNTIVMGPWFHGQWGTARPRREDGQRPLRRQDRRLLPRVDHLPVLRASPARQARPQAARGDGLPDRDEPVEAARRLAAQVGQAEGVVPPGGRQARDGTPSPGGAEFDEYVSDPAHPVPFIEEVNVGMTREYMTDDQRFASRAPTSSSTRPNP